MISYKPNHYCIHPSNYITELHSYNPSHCGTCETPIAGKTFNCGACNSHLHPFCTTNKETLVSGIHPEHPLTRLKHDNILNFTRHCAVCSEEIKGAWYTCSGGCNFDVHPQCSQLPCRVPHELVVGLMPTETAHHEFALQLGKETLHAANCHVCGDHCGKWAYRCHACAINVHFWCLLSRNNEPGGPTTTTERGLERYFDTSRHGQGQPHYYNVQMPHPPPPPPHYYAGGYQPPHGNQWGFNQFHNTNNNWGGGEAYLYNPGGRSNAGGGWGGHNHNHSDTSIAGGGWGGHNHNHNDASIAGSGSGAGGSIMGCMGKIGKSLAVSLICDIVLSMLFGC